MNHDTEHTMIGKSANIKKTLELIDKTASAMLNVLITGETGTGKELVARCLYEKSARKGTPFVKVNCAAIPDTLMESELFGYEAGAFTGADKRFRGKFEITKNGVLFLDEIGDMSLYLQAKLLRVLQDGDFSPLGSEKSLGTDAWVISATNKNLEDEIGEKNFRNDLFYRLNTVNIHLQPLRERPEDVPLLIEHFFNQYRRELNRPEMSADAVLNPEAMDRLLSYHWPGNVRELQNIIKRLVVFGCTEEVLKDLEEPTIENTKQDIQQSAVKNKADDFQTEINTTLIEADLAAKVYEGNVPLKKIGKEAVKKAEKRVILHVLNKTHWNRKKTTEILEISYPALLYKMKDLGIYHVY